MTHSPLGNLHRIAPLRGRCRAAAMWLAFVALLGNVLLPAAFSIVVLKEPGRDIPRAGLCGQWPGDAPGKTKPGLLVQHCPLCTMPAAPLSVASWVRGSQRGCRREHAATFDADIGCFDPAWSDASAGSALGSLSPSPIITIPPAAPSGAPRYPKEFRCRSRFSLS